MHCVAKAYFLLCLIIKEAAFAVIRVPVAPNGCPKAIAPPSILTISGLILSSFIQAID